MKLWSAMKKAAYVLTPAAIAMAVVTPYAAPTASATPLVSASEQVAASESEVLGWTQMGPWGPVAKDFPDVMVKQGMVEDISPTGANVACTPEAGENPVVLIHGMNTNAYQSFARMAPELASMGKCVYAFNVGKLSGRFEKDQWSVAGAIPNARNMAPLADSLAELTAKIDVLKKETGAEAVDLVGYSAGGTLAAAYTKQQQGQGVGTVVAVAGALHGTTLMGASYVLDDLNGYNNLGDKAASVVVSPSARDLQKHSEFVAQLEDGGVTVQGVNYVAISTQLDEAVTPIASSQWDSPAAKNIVLQDGCSADLSDHIGITFSPRVIALVANSLGRNVEVPCVPATGFVAGGINDNRDVSPQSLDAIQRSVTRVDSNLDALSNRGANPANSLSN